MAVRPASNDETKRLRALQSLKILDAQADARFERVTRLAKRLFGVPSATVCLGNQGRTQGTAAIDAFVAAQRLGKGTAEHEVFVVTNVRKDPRFRAAELMFEGRPIGFYAGCAVHDAHGKVGTLSLIDPVPRKFTADDAQLLAELAAMVTAELCSLSNATSDFLTKLPNRRGFEQVAAHMVALASRLGLPLAIVVFDLDGFKRINDKHGHAAGDRMLTRFARQLLKNFRESDVVARLGGDEFCALLSGAPAPMVRQILRRLQTRLEEDPEAPIYFSAGIAILDAARHKTIEDLLRDADKAMYSAKRRKKANDTRKRR
jgi:diguanylate cyclase (GGDEF)-like protein